MTQIAAAQTTRTADESEKQTRLTDFEDAAAAERWKTVNDGVMGGKSKGGMSVQDGVMTFAGTINTDGGGFSSVRMSVKPGTLAGCGRLLLRVKGDGRTYRLTVEDDRGDPERRPNFGKDMPAGPAGEWRTVSVALGDMKPTFPRRTRRRQAAAKGPHRPGRHHLERRPRRAVHARRRLDRRGGVTRVHLCERLPSTTARQRCGVACHAAP